MKPFHKTILIVEDDPNDAEMIERCFRMAGVTGPIHRVENGLEAMEYLRGDGKYRDRKSYAYPTFIITDLKMPKADGFSVLEQLASNPMWAMIPTVVLSGSIDSDDIRRAYLLGACSYHEKPATLAELQQQIKALHDYWLTCHVPSVDTLGNHQPTSSLGKLGARFDLA